MSQAMTPVPLLPDITSCKPCMHVVHAYCLIALNAPKPAQQLVPSSNAACENIAATQQKYPGKYPPMRRHAILTCLFAYTSIKASFSSSSSTIAWNSSLLMPIRSTSLLSIT
eukprot:GHRR01014243.1.p2 GENE.GHRR01014243.1~~GHRR01014243.1.p2  ORF type:complete len:112 (+),score=10.11 GHRR01014243.1:778-1113(+)